MAKTCTTPVLGDKMYDTDSPMHIETPLVYAPLMSTRIGYDVYLKLENLQPSQSFKYRGISLFAIRAIEKYGLSVHLVAASSGNAGLALAWAGKSLGVRVSIFIPATASSAQAALQIAGADVVVEGNEYADALLNAKQFCKNNPQAVLVPSYDHPTLWEGHATMIHEVARQLPNNIVPDAVLCSVGGGGLLCGVLKGANDVGWERTQVITSETHGANAYHLSLLANVKDPHVRALIPVDTTLSTVTATSPNSPQANMTIATLPAITSEAISLGARSPAHMAVELGLERRFKASRDPMNYSGLTAVSLPDEIVIHTVLEFLDEQKMLVELACAATLAHVYVPGLLDKLVPKTDPSHRPVLVFIVCGGAKTTLQDIERYHNIVKQSGTSGFEIARQHIMIESELEVKSLRTQ